jgi:hypothetical protein
MHDREASKSAARSLKEPMSEEDREYILWMADHIECELNDAFYDRNVNGDDSYLKDLDKRYAAGFLTTDFLPLPRAWPMCIDCRLDLWQGSDGAGGDQRRGLSGWFAEGADGPGKGAGPGAPGRGHEPQQLGGGSMLIKANTRRPSPFTSGR